MELEPFQVTRSPASARSCKASGTEPERGPCSAGVRMKTKRLRRSTRAAWMALKRPDSRQESEEVGTKTTVRLCSMQSNTAFAAAEKREQTSVSSVSLYFLWRASIHCTYLSLARHLGHKDRDCSQMFLPKRSLENLCPVRLVLHLCRFCSTSKRHRRSFHLGTHSSSFQYQTGRNGVQIQGRSAGTWGPAVTAESVPQEQNDGHFELHADDYDQNHKQHSEDNTESQGKVARRRRSSSCEEVQEQEVFETPWQTAWLNTGQPTYAFFPRWWWQIFPAGWRFPVCTCNSWADPPRTRFWRPARSWVESLIHCEGKNGVRLKTSCWNRFCKSAGIICWFTLWSSGKRADSCCCQQIRPRSARTGYLKTNTWQPCSRPPRSNLEK